MNAPELSVTLKFRGVTIEGMTVEELRELRNLLDEIVGEKPRVVEREYIPYYPWRVFEPYRGPYWTLTTCEIVSGTELRIDSDGAVSASLTICHNAHD